MTKTKRILWFVGAGLAGALFLSAVYLVVISWTLGPEHAAHLFQRDRSIILPLIVGFAIQSALYIGLKKRLFLPVSHSGPGGALTGASGGVSTVAMVACCAHRITDMLPVLGLTAAAAFLVEHQTAFRLLSMGMTLLGILVMTMILLRERRRVLALPAAGQHG